MNLKQGVNELRQVEQELAGLQEDNDKLLELRNKYGQEFAQADAAWRSNRSQEQLDEMVRAKGLVDTVKSALLDQGSEIAKVEAYVNVLRETLRVDSGLAKVAQRVPRLKEVQTEFGSRTRALQEHMTSELLALDALRVEWDEVHQECWQEIQGLGLRPQEGIERLVKHDVDVVPLRLRIPTEERPINRAHEEAFFFPLRVQAASFDIPGTVNAYCGQTIARTVIKMEADRRNRIYEAQREERKQERARRLWQMS